MRTTSASRIICSVWGFPSPTPTALETTAGPTGTSRQSSLSSGLSLAREGSGPDSLRKIPKRSCTRHACRSQRHPAVPAGYGRHRLPGRPDVSRDLCIYGPDRPQLCGIPLSHQQFLQQPFPLRPEAGAPGAAHSGDHIFTSGEATTLYLQGQKPGASVFLAGTPALEESFFRQAFSLPAAGRTPSPTLQCWALTRPSPTRSCGGCATWCGPACPTLPPIGLQLSCGGWLYARTSGL